MEPFRKLRPHRGACWRLPKFRIASAAGGVRDNRSADRAVVAPCVLSGFLLLGFDLPLCHSLAEDAARTLSRLRGYKPLEVVLAGYDRKNRPFTATVSNLKLNRTGHVEEIRDRFTSDVRWFYPWNPMLDIYVAGAISAFEAKDPTAALLKSYRDHVLKHLKYYGPQLADVHAAQGLVSLVRWAHVHPKYGYLIGQDCLSAVTFPNQPSRKALFSTNIAFPEQPCTDALFTGFYHPDKAFTVLYTPFLADPYMDYMDPYVDLDPQPPDEPRR